MIRLSLLLIGVADVVGGVPDGLPDVLGGLDEVRTEPGEEALGQLLATGLKVQGGRHQLTSSRVSCF